MRDATIIEIIVDYHFINLASNYLRECMFTGKRNVIDNHCVANNGYRVGNITSTQEWCYNASETSKQILYKLDNCRILFFYLHHRNIFMQVFVLFIKPVL